MKSKILNYNEKIQIDIIENLKNEGYYIAKDLIKNLDLNPIRDKFISITTNANEKFRESPRGGIRIGENNFNSYSNNELWCIYRRFEFLWNKPSDENTLSLAIEIHKLRNKIQSFDEDFGLTYNDRNYGIYNSFSYYPPKSGWMKEHSDGHKDVPIVHFMVPLTIKNHDYEEGGLYIINKDNKKINVDDLCQLNDVIFFDGRCGHGVDLIKSNKNIGRLAFFSIPTFFERLSNIPLFLRDTRSKPLIFFTKLKHKLKI